MRVLITFSPEIASALHVQGKIVSGKAIVFCYLGLVFGDCISGWISQVWRSRKKAMLLFLLFTAIVVSILFVSYVVSVSSYYGLCVALGFSSGYSAVFAIIAAELFGTNYRATVATTVPNFVRGIVVPITLVFQ